MVIVRPVRYRDDRSRLRIRLTTLLMLIVGATIVLVAVFFPSWPVVVLLTLAVAALAFVVVRHARSSQYSCPFCQTIFRISPAIDFASPHTAGKKLLKCPHCGKTDWCPEQ